MPDFCEKCRYLSPKGICTQYKTCAAWRRWFRKEWAEIRAVAAMIKEEEE